MNFANLLFCVWSTPSALACAGNEDDDDVVMTEKTTTTTMTDNKKSSPVKYRNKKWKKNKLAPSQQQYRYRKRLPLPKGIKRTDVCVQVYISKALKTEYGADDRLLREVQQTLQGMLLRTYSCSYEKSKLVLKVFLVTVADGKSKNNNTGTGQSSTSASFTPYGNDNGQYVQEKGTHGTLAAQPGEAAVGVAWRIYDKKSFATPSSSSFVKGRETTEQKHKVYDGGMILRTQPMKGNGNGVMGIVSGALLNLTYTNPGAVCVLEELAPLCAQDILTRIGIGTTKFFVPSSSATSSSNTTINTIGTNNSGSTSRRSKLTLKIQNRRPSF